MKLLFSESKSDYSLYLYPYVVWGYPEGSETPADFFEQGFLPSLPALSRFYLCRQLRLPLGQWKPDSENRRVLRKGSEVASELVERGKYEFTAARRASWLAFAEMQFGAGSMPQSRLDRLMSNPVVSHLLRFFDSNTGEELGTVLLYLEGNRVAYYYFSFYDLTKKSLNLGILMMTKAAEFFAAEGFKYLYLGTCYSEKALYKTQFLGVEFFNGHRWSNNLNELKYLIRSVPASHRLDEPDYLAYLEGGLEAAVATGTFRVVERTEPPHPESIIRER